MRRTEFLLTEIRNSTDNSDDNGVKDAELISYLNYGQRLIQNIIFSANPKADIFIKSKDYEYDASGAYALPTDIFAVAAIRDVYYVQGDEEYPMDLIDPSEPMAGYYTEGGNLKVKGYENYKIRLKYFGTLPRMDKRWGKIETVNASTSLVLESGYDADASTVNDYVTVVNSDGAKVLGEVKIDTFTANTWETSNSLSGVSVGDFVCMGRGSVNASLLPEACETYLLDYVRQRVYTRNNYNDAGKQADFTNSQKSDISALFANNQKDILVPPVTDWDALDF